MDEPIRAIRGMTEEQWLACTDPLAMPKVARDRATPRKYSLLACAHVLHCPRGFHTQLGRRIAETIRVAALAGPPGGRDLLRHTRVALARDLPEYFGPAAPPAAYGPCWWPEIRTDLALLAVLWGGPDGRGWAADYHLANEAAAACLNEVRAAARRDALARIEEAGRAAAARKPHPGPYAFPGREEYDARQEAITAAYRDALLGLLPEGEVRERLRLGTWCGAWVPDRVRDKLVRLTIREHARPVAERMAGFVRDVLGNPFRPVTIEPEWLDANFGAARKLADHITTTGSFGDVPVLADALEDAGCRDEALLAHCRTGEHVPGCWVVDAVLGRG